VKELPVEKAPWPDGFAITFYKRCWSFIQDDVLAVMQCFYDLRAGPLGKLNGASIVLIPKTEMEESLRDFRPISLIHSFANLITKTLAIRL
jgi:hypothetical protein